MITYKKVNVRFIMYLKSMVSEFQIINTLMVIFVLEVDLGNYVVIHILLHY